jgi:hypothetical protein
MPIFRYFAWTGLALCGALFGVSTLLGPVEIKPSGAQEMPPEIQKIRTEQTKEKLSPAKNGGAS